MIEYLKTWLALKADRRGVTAMEYALIGSLIAVAIITVLATLGNNIGNTFNSISNAL